MNIYFTLIGLIFLPSLIFSQKIFTTDYPSQSDIKVFVVDYESQSDLKVFKVDYQSQSKGNEGLWYFVKYPSQSVNNLISSIQTYQLYKINKNTKFPR